MSCFVKQLVQKLSVVYGNYIKFDCLTGLRPAQAVTAVRLINDRETFQNYYKPDLMP